MLAYPPIEIRTQLDSETWENAVQVWVGQLDRKSEDTGEFLESYVVNASVDDRSPLRWMCLKLICEGMLPRIISVETCWSFIELYGLTNKDRVTKVVHSLNMASKLRRLGLHYLEEDHLNVIEPLSVVLSSPELAHELVNDDWFKELDRIGGEVAHKVANMSHQALNAADPHKVATIKDLLPQCDDGWIEQILAQYDGNVESATMYLLEHPDKPSPVAAAAAAAKKKKKDVVMAKKQSTRLQKPSKSHLETTLRLLYEDDEHDDTYDDAETMEDGEVKTSKAVDKIEQYLWYMYNRDPKLFNRENRKTPQRAELRKKVDWADEQIEGWASMLERQPKRKDALIDKYFGQRDSEVTLLDTKPAKKSTPPPPQQAPPQEGGSGSTVTPRNKERNKARYGNHNRKDKAARKMQS